jgi:death-on-curing protein
MEVFLVLNGFEIDASVDEQERVVLDIASGGMDREAFAGWLSSRVGPIR